jgi:hypothetical protein
MVRRSAEGELEEYKRRQAKLHMGQHHFIGPDCFRYPDQPLSVGDRGRFRKRHSLDQMDWARVAEVLNRRRSLSISMIRRLHATLGISAEVLIRPSRTVTTGKRQIAR